MRMVHRAFEFVTLFQVVCFALFITLNFDSLNAVEFTINDYGGAVGETITVNVYLLLGAVAVILGFVVFAGLSMFGSGLNDYSTSTMGKMSGYLGLYALLAPGVVYFFGFDLATMLFIEIGSALVMFIDVLTGLQGNSMGDISLE